MYVIHKTHIYHLLKNLKNKKYTKRLYTERLENDPKQ